MLTKKIYLDNNLMIIQYFSNSGSLYVRLSCNNWRTWWFNGCRQFDDKMKLKTGNENREYKIEVIRNSAVYVQKSKLGYLLKLYYLVL